MDADKSVPHWDIGMRSTIYISCTKSFVVKIEAEKAYSFVGWDLLTKPSTREMQDVTLVA
jgi:hypothetical protein